MKERKKEKKTHWGFVMLFSVDAQNPQREPERDANSILYFLGDPEKLGINSIWKQGLKCFQKLSLRGIICVLCIKI